MVCFSPPVAMNATTMLNLGTVANASKRSAAASALPSAYPAACTDTGHMQHEFDARNQASNAEDAHAHYRALNQARPATDEMIRIGA